MAYSQAVVAALLLVSYTVIIRFMRNTRRGQESRRDERNKYLPGLLAEMKENEMVEPESDQDREIPENVLKFLRWQIDVAMIGNDDWSGYDVVEQFQPAALRYQIVEGVYTLAFANRFYTPSFRGSYLQEAQEKLIYKYCQEKVLNYWKWECLWGKLVSYNTFQAIVTSLTFLSCLDNEL
jgi:hypothetical protein